MRREDKYMKYNSSCIMSTRRLGREYPLVILGEGRNALAGPKRLCGNGPAVFYIPTDTDRPYYH